MPEAGSTDRKGDIKNTISPAKNLGAEWFNVQPCGFHIESTRGYFTMSSSPPKLDHWDVKVTSTHVWSGDGESLNFHEQMTL